MKILIDLIKKAESVLKKEPKLIELPDSGRVVFAGDTHGDLEASKYVIENFLGNGKIVFLGDYVDRGFFSRENINFLLETKIENPKDLILLMGNHETFLYERFSPADFWFSLGDKQDLYGRLLLNLPLAVFSRNIIALHGALPDVSSTNAINSVNPGSENFFRMVWGDFKETEGGYLGLDLFTGRPRFGSGYFNKIMSRFGKNVLIRSHDPSAKQIIFNKRCLTIFTSHAYLPKRTIAIVDLKKEIKSTDDIEILEI